MRSKYKVLMPVLLVIVFTLPIVLANPGFESCKLIIAVDKKLTITSAYDGDVTYLGNMTDPSNPNVTWYKYELTASHEFDYPWPLDISGAWVTVKEFIGVDELLIDNSATLKDANVTIVVENKKIVKSLTVVVVAGTLTRHEIKIDDVNETNVVSLAKYVNDLDDVHVTLIEDVSWIDAALAWVGRQFAFWTSNAYTFLGLIAIIGAFMFFFKVKISVKKRR